MKFCDHGDDVLVICDGRGTGPKTISGDILIVEYAGCLCGIRYKNSLRMGMKHE